MSIYFRFEEEQKKRQSGRDTSESEQVETVGNRLLIFNLKKKISTCLWLLYIISNLRTYFCAPFAVFLAEIVSHLFLYLHPSGEDCQVGIVKLKTLLICELQAMLLFSVEVPAYGSGAFTGKLFFCATRLTALAEKVYFVVIKIKIFQF